jgi:hypothetical protein
MMAKPTKDEILKAADDLRDLLNEFFLAGPFCTSCRLGFTLKIVKHPSGDI